jgi:putative transposase
MSDVSELAVDVGVLASCDALGLPRAGYYRWKSPPPPPERPAEARVRAPSPRALSLDESHAVLDTLHSDPFLDRSPGHVVAQLLSQGIWLASERTMYRILKAHGETQERRRQRSHPVYVKPQLVATGPNQVWTWDITKVRGQEKGLWFHLFVLLDIFSRCVVGWTLARRSNATVASYLLQETLRKYAIQAGTLTVHNDRGPEFIETDITKLFEKLDVTRSFSRPRTSNDNAYSESQFKTTKYHPDYPSAFEGFESAWTYFERFFEWYNTEHRHSGIAWLTPQEVHTGQAAEVLARHQATKDAAYAANPERFVNGPPRVHPLPTEVWINGPTEVASSEPPRH